MRQGEADMGTTTLTGTGPAPVSGASTAATECLLDEISDSLEVVNNLVYLLETLPGNSPEVKAYCDLLATHLDRVPHAAHRSLHQCGFRGAA